MLRKSWLTTPLVRERKRPEIREPAKPRPFRAVALVVLLTVAIVRFALMRTFRPDSAFERAQLVRRLLERLGGLWVKVGQLLAMRRDLFDDAFCDHLAQLQDHATGFPFEYVQRTVETELGGSIEELFDSFDEQPFAAASIGQLHRARIRGGQVEVAVKIRRPFVNRTMLADIKVVRRMVQWFIRLRLAAFFRWEDFYVELERTLAEELDYRFEATYLRLMRKNLKRHRIYVPKVYRRLSAQGVLTMEFVRGALMSDYLRLRQEEPQRVKHWLAENGIAPAKVGERLTLSLSRQIFEDNLFHGDLHPGNIILLRNNRVALIDMGSIGWLEGEFLRRYRQLQLAMAEGEYAKVADLFLLLAPSLPPIDLEPARRDLVRFIRSWAVKAQSDDMPFAEKSFGYSYGELGRIFYRYRIPATWTFMRINRAQITLDASLQALFPDMDYFKLNRKYAKQAAKRRFKAATRNGRFLRDIGETLIEGTALLRGASEQNLLELEWLRKRARVFELGPTKAAHFGVLAFNTLLLLGLLSLGGLVILSLRQSGRAAFVSPELDALLAQVPTIPREGWWAIWFVVGVTLFQVWRLRRRLAQPDVALPGIGRRQ